MGVLAVIRCIWGARLCPEELWRFRVPRLVRGAGTCLPEPWGRSALGALMPTSILGAQRQPTERKKLPSVGSLRREGHHPLRPSDHVPPRPSAHSPGDASGGFWGRVGGGSGRPLSALETRGREVAAAARRLPRSVPAGRGSRGRRGWPGGSWRGGNAGRGDRRGVLGATASHEPLACELGLDQSPWRDTPRFLLYT